MTLETRQGTKYIKAFEDKYPDAFIVAGEPHTTFGEMHEMVTWGKENLLFDALVTLINTKDSNGNVIMLWHLTNDIDTMAVKLRWI